MRVEDSKGFSAFFRLSPEKRWAMEGRDAALFLLTGWREGENVFRLSE